jgi:ubiquinone/menaquinone biosynthesis C-methylase UbiE
MPSGRILDAIGVRPGMTVAEIGAGNGRFAVKIAERVGTKGEVYANDINPKALSFMRERFRRENRANVKVVEGTESDPRLPVRKMDMVVLVATLHCVAEPLPLLKNIAPALKPDGLLAVVDPDKEKLTKQGKEHWMAIPKEKILALLEEAGYRLIQEHTFLEIDHIFIFRK